MNLWFSRFVLDSKKTKTRSTRFLDYLVFTQLNVSNLFNKRNIKMQKCPSRCWQKIFTFCCEAAWTHSAPVRCLWWWVGVGCGPAGPFILPPSLFCLYSMSLHPSPSSCCLPSSPSLSLFLPSSDFRCECEDGWRRAKVTHTWQHHKHIGAHSTDGEVGQLTRGWMCSAGI